MQPLRTCTRLIFCLFLFLCHTEHMQLGFPQMKPPTHQVQYENLGLPVMTFGFLFPVEHSARATINTHRHTHKHTRKHPDKHTDTHIHTNTQIFHSDSQHSLPCVQVLYLFVNDSYSNIGDIYQEHLGVSSMDSKDIVPCFYF